METPRIPDRQKKTTKTLPVPCRISLRGLKVRFKKNYGFVAHLLGAPFEKLWLIQNVRVVKKNFCYRQLGFPGLNGSHCAIGNCAFITKEETDHFPEKATKASGSKPDCPSGFFLWSNFSTKRKRHAHGRFDPCAHLDRHRPR